VRWPSWIWTACFVVTLGGLLSFPLVRLVQGGEVYTLLPNLQVDADSYDRLAQEVLRTGSLSAIPPTFAPGFVTILAVVYATFGHSIVAAKTLLWICLVLATIGAALLARRVHGTAAAGWTAAFLTASSAALQAYTGTIQYEVLVAALILALIALTLRVIAPQKPGALVWRAVLLGAALGVAVLIRETIIVLVPVFALFVAHRAHRAHRAHPAHPAHPATLRARARVGAAAGLAVLVCAMAVPLGWSAAESRRMGRVMLVRDNVQGILPFGHNPYANGTWNAALAGIGEPSGIAFIIAEPRLELWLLGRKLMYFWGVLRDGWNVPRPGAVWLARATGGLLPLDLLLPVIRGGWILAALLAACLALRGDQWREYWLLPGTIASLMFVHLVTISSHRFAIPILPVAFVLVAGVISRSISWFISRVVDRTRVGGLAVRGVVLAAAVTAILTAGSVMQAYQWPVRYRLQPTELDGVNGENRTEPDGRLVRVSDAARGQRVAFALYDEYLPSGPVTLRLQIRRGAGDLPVGTPVARVSLFRIDGSPPCYTPITIGQLAPPDTWTQFTLSCNVPSDGPTRFIVDTLGRVDLSFGDAHLQWRR
jgi:Dolichyl-phosphate-mannose-protein mannosyltransferase